LTGSKKEKMEDLSIENYLQKRIDALNAEVNSWQAAYDKARQESRILEEALQNLRKASNEFRILMLGASDAIQLDGIYLAQVKTAWHLLPLETVLSFLDWHEAHGKIAADIVSASRDKNALKDRLKKQAQSKVQEAQNLRDKPERVKKENEVRRAVNAVDKIEKKALEGIMKTLKCDEETAKNYLKGMKGKN
jgi:hypothetical protein